MRCSISVGLDIVIHEEGMVEGTIGDAVFVDSVLKSNRGEFGRQLNFATDYIIADGTITGAIVAGEDESTEKEYTVPFNLEDGRLRGSLFWKEGSKYPYPLCTRLEMVRSQ